jgi:hypothetical protein
MLAIAESHLTGTGSIPVELNRILYHPEAIVLAADPAETLRPIHEAARKATQAVTGHSGATERSSPRWTPHVTLCYSTSTQPAGPIIAALGKQLPECRVLIDTLSLVIQLGAEWLWNWSPVGTISLPRSLQTRCQSVKHVPPPMPFRRAAQYFLLSHPRRLNSHGSLRAGHQG